MRIFWPPAEAAQADYERLRAAALAGTALTDVTELRFARGGLSALIARPVSPPNLVATVHGALRRPWSAQADPRLTLWRPGSCCCSAPLTHTPSLRNKEKPSESRSRAATIALLPGGRPPNGEDPG